MVKIQKDPKYTRIEDLLAELNKKEWDGKIGGAFQDVQLPTPKPRPKCRFFCESCYFEEEYYLVDEDMQETHCTECGGTMHRCGF